MIKHNYECNYVKMRCDKRPSIDSFVNLEYGHNSTHVLGEVDVWEIYPKYDVYFEVKTRDSYKQQQKAMKQTLRWSRYMYKMDSKKNYYGVYYTPQKIKILCKNGEVR